MPLAGTQNSERVKCVEYKLLLSARPRTERWNALQNVALKIHFLVPKCLCKQATKNVFNVRSILNIAKKAKVKTKYIWSNFSVD